MHPTSDSCILRLRSFLWPWNLRATFVSVAALGAGPVRLQLDVGQFFADAVAKLCNAIAKGRRALEVQVLGGGIHLLLELGDVFLRDIDRFIGAADGGVRLS